MSDWHLSKEINVGIVLVIVGQLVLGTVWLGKIDTRVDNLESDVAALTQIPVQLAKIEAAVQSVDDKYSDMAAWMRRFDERWYTQYQERPSDGGDGR